jgi:hypothetical protein
MEVNGQLHALAMSQSQSHGEEQTLCFFWELNPDYLVVHPTVLSLY